MSISRKKRYTIGVMLGDTQSDYSEELLSGFYTCAKEEDVNLIFLMGPQTPQYCSDILSSDNNGHYRYQFDTIYDYVYFSKVDALIIAYGSLSMSTRSKELDIFLKNYKDIPYLLLEDVPNHVDAPYLIADNYSGIHNCLEHLISYHHYKKIAFVCGPKLNRDSNERLRAYLDSMKEHDLPVTDDMIVYGDYSEDADSQVEYLLEKNPGLEAIAFANDNMAKAGYRVCTRHNLLIGKDIAITGFDNVDFSQTMTPPLTSVSHSSFLFSYTALKNALMLCEGRTPASKRMPTHFHKRCSCGCASKNQLTYTKIPEEDIKWFIDTCAAKIASDVLSAIPYENNRILYTTLIHDFFFYIYENAFVKANMDPHDNYLMAVLKKLLAYNHISSVLILERFTNLLRILIANAKDDTTQDILSGVISSLHQYIHLKDVTSLEDQIVDSNRKSWFIPTFTRDLISGDISFRDSVVDIMDRFKMMHIKGAYFYLFEEPVLFQAGEPLIFNEKMYLTGYYNQTECHYYEDGERPVLSENVGFSSFLPENQNQCLTAFVLFSGKEQYGAILCEVEQKDISFVQICSLQLGSLLRFMELNKKEKQVQQELHNSLKIIQEKNNILSFISEYDELSKLLNRRGFMERAISTCNASTGCHGHLIFGDLDHLKEINDSFGHACGDYAIRTAADLLTANLPNDALVARIGGDEFIALVLSEDPDFTDIFCRNLKQSQNQQNSCSDQPFYVEISVGIESFICNAQIDLNEIIKKSDKILYQAKAYRRRSIRKICNPTK